MTLLKTLDRLLVRVETILLVSFLGAMVLLSFAQVVLRNLFDTGFLWGDILVRHLVLWAGFIGAGIATSEQRHISIDAFTKLLPPRVTAASRAVTSLFAMVVCLVLADAAYKFLVLEQEMGGHLVGSVPTWVGVLIIPQGYLVMAFHFLVKCFDAAGQAFRRAA